MLVAEIPSSNNRWKQANFHRDDYVNFFGATPGVARLVVFRHVKANGTMAEYERDRHAITVKSRNFRFELAAAAGVPYPDPERGRPIGVFIRVGTRAFFYRLLLPGDGEYGVVSDLLTRRAGPPKITHDRRLRRRQRMRSVRMTVAELRREWTDAPFWRLPTSSY